MGRGSGLAETRRVDELCKRIYGERIMNSDRAGDCITEIRYALISFKQSGEIEFPEDGVLVNEFTITPKIFETLATHELEMQKHRATVRTARWQAFASILLVILTGLLVYVTWITQ